MPPELLAGRYRIFSPLGAGGMGEVFLAEDTRLERRVAVKMLPASVEADAVARERLRREALAAAALDHPFICRVHEIGDADGRMFIVMEYVEGDTLHTHARRALLPVRQVIDIAHELTQALDAAHRRGLVHRDLKPANVMLTPQGHVRVMDFGLAKQIVARPNPPGAGSEPGTQTHGGVASTDARVALTDAGTPIGTPAYMSPEQILGAALDPRSDLFSLGVILHELATGRHPFLRDDPSDTMAAILRDPPTSGSRDLDEPAGFGAVIHRLLSKACAERHQTPPHCSTTSRRCAPTCGRQRASPRRRPQLQQSARRSWGATPSPPNWRVCSTRCSSARAGSCSWVANPAWARRGWRAS